MNAFRRGVDIRLGSGYFCIDSPSCAFSGSFCSSSPNHDLGSCKQRSFGLGVVLLSQDALQTPAVAAGDTNCTGGSGCQAG